MSLAGEPGPNDLTGGRRANDDVHWADPGLAGISHIVVLMLGNRSFDHLLGYLCADTGNASPPGQPFERLTGNESNPDASGDPVSVYPITPSRPNAYFMPDADPGEGYQATNDQL